MWTDNFLLRTLCFFPFSLSFSLKINGRKIERNGSEISYLEETKSNVSYPSTAIEDFETEYIEDEGSVFFGQAGFEIPGFGENNNSSLITIFHKISSDNITRHGVTTIPSSLIISLLETAVGSLSGETLFLLVLGGLLPVLMISMPFVVTLAMAGLLIMIVLLMTGVFTSTLVFMPLTLVMFGLYLAMDTDLHNFIGEQIENIPSLEEIERIGQAISEAMENMEVSEEENIFEQNDYSVPRVLF